MSETKSPKLHEARVRWRRRECLCEINRRLFPKREALLAEARKNTRVLTGKERLP